MPGQAPAPATAARTVYAFLIASTIIVASGALIARRSLRGLSTGFGPLDAAGLACGVSALVIVALLASRLPRRPAGQTVDDWWRAHTGRAVLLWSLLELPAMIGAVTLFATGHLVAYLLLAVLALGGLAVTGPARLVAE